MRNYLLLILVGTLFFLGFPRIDTWRQNVSDFNSLITRISKEPELETYSTDMDAYLRTYYQIKSGKPYYLSFGQSVVGDASIDNLPGEIWGWKLPFIFYLWAILPGTPGVSVYIGFILLVTAVLFAAYKLGTRLNRPWGILSVWLLTPYFVTPLTQMTLFQVEWWALCFFILGLTLLVFEKKIPAMLFFALAVFTRELFLFHLVMVLGVYLLFRRYRDLWVFVVPALALIFIYVFYHVPNVYQFESFGPVTGWWRSGWTRGWFLVRPTLSFSSWNYIFYQFHPLRVALIVASVSLAARFIFFRPRLLPALAFATFAPFFIFIFFFGIQTKWQDYWGIYYVPFVLIFAPTILSIIRRYEK